MRGKSFLFLVLAAFLGPSVSFHGIYLFHFALLAWLVGFGLSEKNNIKDWLKKARTDRYFWIVPLLLGWFSLSLLWADDLKYGLMFIAQLGMGLVLTMIIAIELKTEENSSGFYRLMGFLLLATLILSLLEIFTPFRWPISHYNSQSNFFGYAAHVPVDLFEAAFMRITPTSFFWNPNNLALVLLLFVPFLLISNGKEKYWLVPIIIAVVFFAGGRLALITLLLQLALSLFFVRPVPFILCAIGVVTLVVLSFYPMLLPAKADNNVSGILTEKSTQVIPFDMSGSFGAKSEVKDNSISVRRVLIEKGFQYFKTSKGLGIGAGSSRARLIKEGGIGRNHITNLHNFWLELLCEGGLLVLGILGFISCRFLVDLFKIWQKDLEKRNETSMLMLGALGLFIGVVSLSSAVYFLPVYLFLGVLVSRVSLLRK